MTIEVVETIVLGGGLIGHLVGTLLPDALILDRRPTPAPLGVTHQPGAHYLWSALRGLLCESFDVVTRIDNEIATPESIEAYKAKVHEPLPSPLRANGEPSYRMQQFVPRMTGWRARLPDVDVLWGQQVVEVDVMKRIVKRANGNPIAYDRLINTIPLKTFLPLLTNAYLSPLTLLNRQIWIERTEFPEARFDFGRMDTLYVNYVADPTLPYYRETHTSDGRIQRESLTQYDPGQICIQPGKLVAHPAVPYALERLKADRIFNFGHYATWDPDELTHHTWEKLLMFVGRIR